MSLARIAVVSDLHVGRSARCKDLCPYTDTLHPHVSGWDEFGLEYAGKEDGYLEQFLEFLGRGPTHADYLIVGGDITDSGQPLEVKGAASAIERIAAALEVPQQRVFFVPGNHDSDWNVLDLYDPTDFRFAQRYAPLRNPEWRFGSPGGYVGAEALDEPYCSVFQDDRVLVVGYNSSWNDARERKLHHGLISPDHMTRLGRQLDGIAADPALVKLFVLHHHLHPYPRPNPADSGPEVSIAARGGELLALLDQYHFDFLVHGHLHYPAFQVTSLASGNLIGMLCAGSFSCEPPRHSLGQVTNYFHLVDVQDRHPVSSSIQGTVYSWAYQPAGNWIPAWRSRLCGLDSRCAFGEYVMPGQLKELLRPIIARRLAESKVVEYQHLEKELPGCNLGYVPSGTVNQVLSELAKEFGAKKKGDLPDGVIIWKADD